MRRAPSLLQLGHGPRRWWLWLHHRFRHLPLSPSSSSSSYTTSYSKSPRLAVLLVAACTSLSLFLLLAAASVATLPPSMTWIMPGEETDGGTALSLSASDLILPHGPGPGTADEIGYRTRGWYTVVINTWKRDDLLKRSVRHYASCHGVDAIRVVWSEPDPPSLDLRDSLAKLTAHRTSWRRSPSTAAVTARPPVVFDVNRENSLNNRFKVPEGLATDAVYSVDDDVILPCQTVEFAFQVWRTAPEAMVGFVPRMHWTHQQLPGGTVMYRYGGWLSVWWRGTYSMVLSKVAFFHRNYLSVYTNEMHASIRDYVTANRNCEDIAMSFLVANLTKAPPIWVQGRVSEIGSFGISSMGGHNQRRSQCLNDFATIYGHMPLVPTTVKAVDSRTAWFW